jgi:hypothetical protein
MILQQTHQNKGPRPTLGGRTQRSFDGRHVSRAKQPFGAQHQQCALPGGGSGAARRAAGRNSLSEAPAFDEAPR